MLSYESDEASAIEGQSNSAELVSGSRAILIQDALTKEYETLHKELESKAHGDDTENNKESKTGLEEA